MFAKNVSTWSQSFYDELDLNELELDEKVISSPQGKLRNRERIWFNSNMTRHVLFKLVENSVMKTGDLLRFSTNLTGNRLIKNDFRPD